MNIRNTLLVSTSSLMLLALPSCSKKSEPQQPQAPENNTLTDAEKAAGWQLLFDGKSFDGWHKFKQEGMGPGWVIEDGAMAKKEGGGDIVTSNKFSWFELQLDYNITDGGNSGVMYHVTGEENANWPTWYTGPEFQLLDNVNGRDAMPRQMSGWLYGLYAPPDDPKTGLPLDTTKPVGQWNHIRLLVTPEKCEHDMNGVKYFEYVLHSPDFNARVARSKFSQMPPFAKSDTGVIALQGDHGAISFRNIKIRVINGK